MVTGIILITLVMKLSNMVKIHDSCVDFMRTGIILITFLSSMVKIPSNTVAVPPQRRKLCQTEEFARTYLGAHESLGLTTWVTT